MLALNVAPAAAWHSEPRKDALSPAVLRALLLVGGFATVALALSCSAPAAALKADAELALLLRGMAMIKASLVLAAMGVLWWRLGHPVGGRAATGYLLGIYLTAAATALIWHLTLIPLAALAFHVGGFTLLLVGLADQRSAHFTMPSFRARR